MDKNKRFITDKAEESRGNRNEFKSPVNHSKQDKVLRRKIDKIPAGGRSQNFMSILRAKESLVF